MVRFNQQGVFVNGGYIPGGETFSALLVGYEQGRDLLFVERLVVGLISQARTEVFDAVRDFRLRIARSQTCRRVTELPPNFTEAVMRQCVGVKLERRCEVAFMERTKSGKTAARRVPKADLAGG